MDLISLRDGEYNTYNFSLFLSLFLFNVCKKDSENQYKALWNRLKHFKCILLLILASIRLFVALMKQYRQKVCNRNGNIAACSPLCGTDET